MLYLQRVMKNVTSSFIYIYPNKHIVYIKNQVEDTIDHTTEKKELITQTTINNTKYYKLYEDFF